MIDYHELVKLPARTDINTGLSPAKPYTMLSLLGVPGRLTQDCSPVTNARLRSQMVTHKFNNFTVTGWRPAVESLIAVLTEVNEADPALHDAIGSSGMLCCRLVRGASQTFSNHSWGSAIDLNVNGRLDPMGATHVQKGILMLYRFFHKHGWYWSAGLVSRSDPMHFELADSTMKKLYRQYYG